MLAEVYVAEDNATDLEKNISFQASLAEITNQKSFLEIPDILAPCCCLHQ